MRTLIVYGNHHALARALSVNGADVHMGASVRCALMPFVYTIQSVERPEDVVQGMVVSGPQHLERLRGFEYDVVIEDGSFNLHDWVFDSCLPHSFEYDRHAQWSTFLQAYVLRKG